MLRSMKKRIKNTVDLTEKLKRLNFTHAIFEGILGRLRKGREWVGGEFKTGNQGKHYSVLKIALQAAIFTCIGSCLLASNCSSMCFDLISFAISKLR